MARTCAITNASSHEILPSVTQEMHPHLGATFPRFTAPVPLFSDDIAIKLTRIARIPLFGFEQIYIHLVGRSLVFNCLDSSAAGYTCMKLSSRNFGLYRLMAWVMRSLLSGDLRLTALNVEIIINPLWV